MKPVDAKPGQRLYYTSPNGSQRVAYFEKRVPRYGKQPPCNILRIPDFEGMYGPDDKGFCSLTDREMKRSCAPACR